MANAGAVVSTDGLGLVEKVAAAGMPPAGWQGPGVVPSPIGRTYTQSELDAAVAAERERIGMIADEIENAWPEGRQTACMIREGVTVLASHVSSDVEATRSAALQRLRTALMELHTNADGTHNYYHYAVVKLFGA